jgi:hypothetical protein
LEAQGKARLGYQLSEEMRGTDRISSCFRRFDPNSLITRRIGGLEQSLSTGKFFVLFRSSEQRK